MDLDKLFPPQNLVNILKDLGKDPRIILEDDYGWWTPQEFLARYRPKSKNRPRGALNGGAHIYNGSLIMDNDWGGHCFIPTARLRCCVVDDKGQHVLDEDDQYIELDYGTRDYIVDCLEDLWPR